MNPFNNWGYWRELDISSQDRSKLMQNHEEITTMLYWLEHEKYHAPWHEYVILSVWLKHKSLYIVLTTKAAQTVRIYDEEIELPPASCLDHELKEPQVTCEQSGLLVSG